MRVALFLALAAGCLIAAPIGNLFNTGLPGPNGTDANWLVDGSPAFVTERTQFPFPFWATQPNSQWISPQPSYAAATDARDRTFVFRTTFNLPDTFSAATIVMRVATDNALAEVRLNGAPIPFARSPRVLPGNTLETSVIAGGTGFLLGVGAPLAITTNFRPGENVLDLHVRNGATGESNFRNPTGLVAEFESDVAFEPSDPVTATPEPGSVALTAVGLALLCAGARRRS